MLAERPEEVIIMMEKCFEKPPNGRPKKHETISDPSAKLPTQTSLFSSEIYHRESGMTVEEYLNHVGRVLISCV